MLTKSGLQKLKQQNFEQSFLIKANYGFSRTNLPLRFTTFL
ncbi:MAG: hypothetical protein RIQ89_9 [Bacteroidota bacterium]|jgi:hypothetical protein